MRRRACWPGRWRWRGRADHRSAIRRRNSQPNSPSALPPPGYANGSQIETISDFCSICIPAKNAKGDKMTQRSFIRALSHWRTESIAVGCVVALAYSQASADDVIGIRCVGYEVPIVMFPSGKVVGFASKEEPFDIHISPSRGIGWWSGSTFFIDEEHPAKLTMDTAKYTLDATRASAGEKSSEWLVLDRIAGTVTHYARIAEGSPSGELKRGGTCSKLEPKF